MSYLNRITAGRVSYICRAWPRSVDRACRVRLCRWLIAHTLAPLKASLTWVNQHGMGRTMATVPALDQEGRAARHLFMCAQSRWTRC